MSDKILVTCDCTCADTCPQGRIGSRAKCRILRDPQIEATIERPTASPSDIELVTIGTLRRDVADLRSRINAVSSALQGTDHEGENVKRRLNDISKQLVANEDTMKTQDRAIGILSDRLDHHNISLPQEASIKRVIKGGWVNVYWSEQHQKVTALGDVYPEKSGADRAPAIGYRIACIQIPDITEGEGL